jgi:hypothetical protein
MKNLYVDDQKQNFNKLFNNPGSLYRGTPFWAWNCKLDKDLLFRQIDCFEEMGLGGFHMHSRTGLATEYLGDEFSDMVRSCVDYAKEKNMLAWLYDEDRWPSGAAGGLVTKDIEYRARQLLFMPYTYEQYATMQNENVYKDPKDHEKYIQLLKRYDIKLDKNGYLTDYKILSDGVTGENVWYLYRAIDTTSTWFNNQTYVDTLSKKAIERFIEVTHEKYKEIAGDEFSKTVPAIFTDEPQVPRKSTLVFAKNRQVIKQPFTDEFPESYKAAYNQDFFETFPEIIWNLPDNQYSVARYRFHEHTAELFASSFADTIGDWCEENNIRLTGHMMEEPSLHSQTAAIGDAMRSYRSFQLPGIDMLCDHREYTTAKQAQSASRQYGCGGVLSELYGVTNWDFDFNGHKNQGDWQAALGVTVRVQHLAWVSMQGEAKRDYPASINYQSPWYKKYSYIEDHFARINVAMTRGKADVKVGVIHPIESFWLDFGPNDQTAQKKEEAEYYFSTLCEWLLFGLVDFDYIAESLLDDQNDGINSNKFQVGEMQYDVLIVPPMKTMRSTTFERLKKFQKKGGRIIFVGDVAKMIDVQDDDSLENLSDLCIKAPFSKSSILSKLDNVRDVNILDSNGTQTKTFLYQMRTIDASNKMLFICNTDKDSEVIFSSYNYGFTGKIFIKGEWQISIMDTSTGEIFPIEGEIKNQMTSFSANFYATEHMLLKLEKSDKCCGKKLSSRISNTDEQEQLTLDRLNEVCKVKFDESNALLLDFPKCSIDGEKVEGLNEILRLDNIIRDKLGLKPQIGRIAQPWTDPIDNNIYGQVELKYNFKSDINIKNPKLAIETPEIMNISLNGKQADSTIKGYWADEAIKTLKLPEICKGENILTINVNYKASTQLERCYILGEFGVEIDNQNLKLVEMPTKLSFGSITEKKLPFYTGNISYLNSFETDEVQDYVLSLPYYNGALVEVICDGKNMGAIISAPYKVELVRLEKGRHHLELKLYGNRFNTFGSIHGTKPFAWNGGPDNWRSTGDNWTDNYNLRPLGIMFAPRIQKK